jgi:hypothetical protein
MNIRLFLSYDSDCNIGSVRNQLRFQTNAKDHEIMVSWPLGMLCWKSVKWQDGVKQVARFSSQRTVVMQSSGGS